MSTAQASSDLLTQYSSLPEDERLILEMISVIYQPMNKNRINDALAVFAQQPWNGRTFTRELTKVLIDRWLDAGLLVESNKRYACPLSLAEYATRNLVDSGHYDRASQAVATMLQQNPLSDQLRRHQDYQNYLVRDALYRGDVGRLLRRLEINDPWSEISSLQTKPLLDLYYRAPDPDWLAKLPVEIRFLILAPILRLGSRVLKNPKDIWPLFEANFAQNQPHPAINQLLIEQYLLRGDIKSAEAVIPTGEQCYELSAQLWLAFFKKGFAQVRTLGEQLLKVLNKGRRKRLALDGITGILYCLSLIESNGDEELAAAETQLRTLLGRKQLDSFTLLYRQLEDLIQLRAARLSQSEWRLTKFNDLDDHPYLVLFYFAIFQWLEEPPSNAIIKQLENNRQQAATEGYVWFEREASALLNPDQPNDQAILPGLIKPIPEWQRALTALQSVIPPQAETDTTTSTPNENDLRMSWRLYCSKSECRLEPREQKYGKKGWTAGRAVSLERLCNETDSYSYLNEQDRKICAVIDREVRYEHYGHYPRTYYSLGGMLALSTAQGHSRLVWGDAPDQPVEIERGEPIIEVKRLKNRLLMQITPYPHQSYTFERKNNTLIIVQSSPQHLRIADILGFTGLDIPLMAEQQLLDGISAIAPLITIHSDIGTGTQAETVNADAMPVVQLQPFGEGLQIDVYVRPLSGGGPLFRPGEGRSTLLTELNGQQLQCERDPQQEQQAANLIVDQCPHLYADGDWNWPLDNPDQALDTLEQLQSMGDQIKLEWPKGEKLRINRPVEIQQMRLSIRKAKEWFSIEGELQLDEERVIAMADLMKLLDQSPGRFLPLGDKEFISLSKTLRQRLQLLRSLTHNEQFHSLASPIVDEVIVGMQIKANKAWRDQLVALEQAQTLDFEPPATLQAELRDYQLEGFRWLARLAHWGAGACLADDMGLGKTLQALALILVRAPKGPTLVLAPTSVCFNWLKEIQRFAPTLKAQQFGPGDRQAMLDNAGSFDLIVCSYGLLQSENERLAQVKWHTLVADEAQAIKNRATKRAKAAKQLSADFRLITTGTPIENHLGEVWNLFNFLNPGLLGSQEQFETRFSRPIEQNQDATARDHLRHLLRPFILRRLKSDVLTELPPRTEITYEVALDVEEVAIYEALRRQALERMTQDNASTGEKRIKILAEITRLRRACCHPRLVLPDSPLQGAKLRAFGEIVQELRANRHRALVFSQFVDHLTVIREYLDEQQIAYQYLDGSTPLKARQTAVEEFQSGKGELFLISLRAGGSGLNLTAADYVIHMDPWWNPAVEDQATDRAHRMGQQRPVTVYRLVTVNTIEQRILQLHQQKRALADELLEGGEQSGKLSVEELIELMREGMEEELSIS